MKILVLADRNMVGWQPFKGLLVVDNQNGIAQ
jgi:hypothetical protein